MPDEKFWQKIYETEENPPWDLGGVSPALVALFEKHPPGPASKILVPGCGRGHDAVYLASIGHEITAVDFAPAAIDATEELARQVRVQVATAKIDVLVMRSAWREHFDVVAEHTCYAGIHPTEREKYVVQLKRVLRPGGLVMGVFFDVKEFPDRQHQLERPPYPSTQEDIRHQFEKAGFETALLEPTPVKHGEKPYAQVLGIFKRV